MPSIKVHNTDISIDVQYGQRLVELCEEKTLAIPVACRAGACGTCAFRILENPAGLTPMSKMEQAFFNKHKPTTADQRLACQCRVVGNIVIDIL